MENDQTQNLCTLLKNTLDAVEINQDASAKAWIKGLLAGKRLHLLLELRYLHWLIIGRFIYQFERFHALWAGCINASDRASIDTENWRFFHYLPENKFDM